MGAFKEFFGIKSKPTGPQPEADFNVNKKWSYQELRRSPQVLGLRRQDRQRLLSDFKTLQDTGSRSVSSRKILKHYTQNPDDYRFKQWIKKQVLTQYSQPKKGLTEVQKQLNIWEIQRSRTAEAKQGGQAVKLANAVKPQEVATTAKRPGATNETPPPAPQTDFIKRTPLTR